MNPRLVTVPTVRALSVTRSIRSGQRERALEQTPQIVQSRAFKAQMTRFVDSATVTKTLATDGYAGY